MLFLIYDEENLVIFLSRIFVGNLGTTLDPQEYQVPRISYTSNIGYTKP
jgi:hypothetical protein